MAPKSLKLEFSKAADQGRISAIFKPSLKAGLDPHNYVVQRPAAIFSQAVRSGAGAFLSDEKKKVRLVTLAYHANENDKPQKPPRHDFTEIGTSLAYLPGGYGSAKLVVAALALREWFLNPPSVDMVAQIKDSNIPSVKTYASGLGWTPVNDQTLNDRIYKATDKTVAPQDKTPNPPPVDTAKEHWYRCGDQALATHARILLSLMQQGGLMNKQTGHKISVDFSALDDAGLTRPRLKALANGETSRARLRQIKGPSL